MATLFTRIINREIPGEIIYEDDNVVAFKDIAPQAPFHAVIVTRDEIPSVAQIPESGDHLHMLNAAKKIAERNKLSSFRLVVNTGPEAGQTVPHLHMHMLSGRPLGWPPG